jgi:hypothetical protein
MLADFRADRHRFLGAALVQLEDNQWLDIVRWASQVDFTESRAKKENLPGVKAFFSAIEEVLTSEQGVACSSE